MSAFHSLRTSAAAMLVASQDWLADEKRAAAVAYAYAKSTTSPEHFDRLAHSHVALRQIIFSGKWAMSGFPTIDVGERLCAALMATSVPPEEADALILDPWPAFVIRLPDGFLRLGSAEHHEPLELVRVHRTRYGPDGKFDWGIAVESERGGADGSPVTLWHSAHTFKDLLEQDNPASTDPFAVPLDTIDRRLLRMAILLVAGVCLELSDPRKFGDARCGKSSGGRPMSGSRVYGEVPDYSRFELRRAVKIDVREAVRCYVTHGVQHASVQTLVRGHWKQQVHGPQRSLRKSIHIAPYWKGDVDAPVSDRSG